MQTKKAFTLLELVVAMAIIATLLGLSLFGIQAVQRSQRDTERRAALQSINLELANYYSENSTYPATGDFDVSANSIVFEGKNIPLKGAAVACASGTASTSSCTLYCYEGPSGGEGSSYKLGVNLEGNGWGSVSTAQQLGNDTSDVCDTAILP